MRKLKLHLDGLRVESFAPQGGGLVGGTVRGHDDTEDCRMTPVCTAYPCLSQDYSCRGSCAPACVTGYPDPCWVSWDPAARCFVPQ